MSAATVSTTLAQTLRPLPAIVTGALVDAILPDPQWLAIVGAEDGEEASGRRCGDGRGWVTEPAQCVTSVTSADDSATVHDGTKTNSLWQRARLSSPSARQKLPVAWREPSHVRSMMHACPSAGIITSCTTSLLDVCKVTVKVCKLQNTGR